MSDAQIKILDDGPIMVSGNIPLTDGEGNQIETKNTYYLCRCGLSDNKPFCNGAHKGKFDSKIRKDS